LVKAHVDREEERQARDQLQAGCDYKISAEAESLLIWSQTVCCLMQEHTLRAALHSRMETLMEVTVKIFRYSPEKDERGHYETYKV
jgi:hypothetical protein